MILHTYIISRPCQGAADNNGLEGDHDVTSLSHYLFVATVEYEYYSYVFGIKESEHRS